MPAVSVIIPVYNAEAAIERCVNSVLNQEFKDLELILLDDGSKDRSPEILDHFAETDNRVKVIHKTNSGVSDTRNKGIDMAEGTYIQFLDADDWITEDSTKMLVRTAMEHDADLVVGQFYRVVGDNLSRKGSIDTDRVLTRQEYAEYMEKSPADYYFGVLWNKLYKKSILDQYHIRMDQKVSFCEDFIFNLDYVLHCERIAALAVPVYYYVKTDGSLVSQNFKLEKLAEMKKSVYEYYDKFFRNVLNEEEYQKERLNIASFLVSPATDEFTIPYMPGTKKVGKEKQSVHFGIRNPLLTQSYFITKLYASYLDTIAMKNDLGSNAMKVFAVVNNASPIHSFSAIADFSGLNEPLVYAEIATLSAMHLVNVSLSPVEISVDTERAAGIIRDLEHAENDLRNICYSSFDEEEIGLADRIIEKMSENLSVRLGRK